MIRDVLARFQPSSNGLVQYELVAVVEDEKADPELLSATEIWLAEAAFAVPTDLGVATLIEARTESQISLAYVEDSYSLDVKSVSWPPNTPGPVGSV